MATNFSSILIGKNTKKYSHPRPLHVNSTSDFGSFQPFISEFLLGGDSINFDKFVQLVRNSTMPSPTFGQLTCRNDFHFVPMCDLFPAFDAMRDRTSIQGTNGLYIPTSMPLISSSELCTLLFMFSEFTSYDVYNLHYETIPDVPGHTHGYRMRPLTFQQLQERFSTYGEMLRQTYNSIFNASDTDIPLSPQVYDNQQVTHTFLRTFWSTTRKSMSRREADFILSVPSSSGSEDGYEIRYKLTAIGRRLFKIFKGLGFSLEITNFNKVSSLPLLAFYKAWFDRYFIQRSSNWHGTKAYALINSIYSTGDIVLNSNTNWDLFKDFIINELPYCYYTYPADFVSANVSQVNEGVADSAASLENAPSTSGSALNSAINGSVNNPTLTGSLVSLVKLQTLDRVQHIFNKRGKIGARVYDYIKSNYGEDVAEDMFKPSYNIGSIETPVVIDDHYSDSDTANIGSDGSGQHLGYRGGKGDGLTENRGVDKYVAPTAGYYIAMFCIYPESNWCQGDRGYLYCKDRFTLPTDEFDALGYELTPRALVYDNNGEYVKGVSPSFDKTSFGFMPRMSFEKFSRNLLNGCMSLRSTRDSFQSFYLDRIVTTPHLYYAKTDTEAPNDEIYIPAGASIPDASTIWFSPLRYSQLGYFNRIFFNSGYPTEGLNQYFYDDLFVKPLDDNFVVQMNIDYNLVNSLKPMSMSYDTYDETKDNATSEIKTN